MSTKEGFTTFRVYSDDQNGKDPKRQKTRATNNYKEIHGQEPKRIVETPEGGSLPFNCDRCYRIKKKCLKEFPTCNYCAKTGNDCVYFARGIGRPKRVTEQDHNGMIMSVEGDESGNSKGDNYNDDNDDDDANVNVNVNVGLRSDSTTVQNIVPNTETPNSVTVSSLLSSEKDDRYRRDYKNTKLFNGLLLAKSFQKKQTESRNLNDEFMTIKAFHDTELPMNFIHSFFYNNEHLFPVFEKHYYLNMVNSIDFKTESIVSFPDYLLLAIGCVIYDSINQKSLFNEYFSEKNIENLLDVIDFNPQGSFTEVNQKNLKLIILFTIYYSQRCNEDMEWNLVGVLARLVLRFKLYKKSENMDSTHKDIQKRYFWSVYFIEKDFSLLNDIPSQLPNIDTIYLDQFNNSFFNQHSEYYRLEDKFILMKLKADIEAVSSSELAEFSKSLDSWRNNVTRWIHLLYGSHQPFKLQESTLFINMCYYYLSIELDELSSTKSSQFTLQFISQFFSLSLLNNDRKSLTNIVGLSINSLPCYRKLFNVVKFNTQNLPTNKDDYQYVSNPDSIPEFVNNFQLMLNLVNYLVYNVQSDYTPQLSALSRDLSSLLKLLMSDTKDIDAILTMGHDILRSL